MTRALLVFLGGLVGVVPASGCTTNSSAPAPGPPCILEPDAPLSRTFTLDGGTVPVACITEAPSATATDAGPPPDAATDGGPDACCADLCARMATASPGAFRVPVLSACSVAIALGTAPVLHCDWVVRSECPID